MNVDDHTWYSKIYILGDKCFQSSFIQGNIKVLREQVVDPFAQIEWTYADFPSFKTKQVGEKNTMCCLTGFVFT